MTPTTPSPAPRDPAVTRRLLPMALLTFLAYMAVGLPLPVLGLHVRGALGYGDLAVGLAIGAQSLATLASRAFAARRIHARGGKHAASLGMAVAAASCACYLASLAFAGRPAASLAVLLAGRAGLGVAESLFLSGVSAWGLGRVGVAHSGKVMAWNGIAMYAALAAGAPLGLLLHRAWGFAAVALAGALLPLAGLLAAARIEAVAPSGQRPLPFARVVGLVLLPGLGLTLSNFGLCAITSFLTLDFVANGWRGADVALTVFGAAYILVRVFFAGLPDRLGGARVAQASLTLHILGLLALFLAPGPGTALAGAALTGLGYSLVYPGFGVEAVRRVPAGSRAAAVSAYPLFFDLSLGVVSPLCGLVAGGWGYASIYLVGAAAGVCSFLLAGRLRKSAAADRLAA